ncbi:MAG TPA: DUF1549 domain-containing protein [Planctomycetaceae bacterium]|nr:DUF1549 domain-containing protein [Planctomycetaceae bacterium]
MRSLSVSSMLVLMAGLCLPPSSATAVEPLSIAPDRIVLSSASDFQRVTVQARREDGSTRDVSSLAKWTLNSDKIAKLDGPLLLPVGDGQAELTVEFDGHRQTIPVEVQGSATPAPLRFRNDVLAVLTRAGCNTGKCHGSASGKDGFRLSLFGYDPAGDHDRITRELSGRRVNLADPEQSLIVQKSLGEVPHTGGQRLERGTAHFETVMAWLAAGAEPDPKDTPRPVSISVLPRDAVFATRGEEQQVVVLAQYSDGTDRDVTDLAVFLSNNEGAATVTADGLVTGTGPGAAFIMARFDQFTQGASIIVRPGTDYRFPEIAANNEIDELVFARLRDLHVMPSELCTDEVFLRRAFIDLIGLLPTEVERAAFLADSASDKRARLVDTLLQRPEFADLWVMKWAELLQIRIANGGSRKGLHLYDQWLREQIRSGRTIDQVVADLIPATGGTFENPPTGYYQTETTPVLLAENLAQALLGTRIQCAQCHNHPFDRWSMDDYYGFAAFFSQVGYKQAQDPRELTIFNAGVGDMRHPVDGRAVAPKFLGGEAPQIPAGHDYRKFLADWVASPDNTAFSENLANVVWAHFFGIGIVEPVDDVRVSNPPSNPALHRALGRKLAGDKFDIRPLVRDICTSRTYQLATQRNAANQWDERHFSHGKIRRMRAEVLLDCINQVTASGDRFPGLPAGARAVQIGDGRTPNYFLSTFGRSTRETACSCEVKTSPTLSQALHLLNGETTSVKIEDGGVIGELLTASPDPLQTVDRLYIRCLSRMPTAEESSAIRTKLAGTTDLSSELTDLFWALLNSNEFIFNH